MKRLLTTVSHMHRSSWHSTSLILTRTGSSLGRNSVRSVYELWYPFLNQLCLYYYDYHDYNHMFAVWEKYGTWPSTSYFQLLRAGRQLLDSPKQNIDCSEWWIMNQSPKVYKAVKASVSVRKLLFHLSTDKLVSMALKFVHIFYNV